jgi:ABC-type sugar transport system substrate-binding protein
MTEKDNGRDETNETLPGRITRRAVLQRGLVAAGSFAVAPAVLRLPSVLRSSVATPGHATATSTQLSKYAPFNPHVAPGAATGLPKRVATNFPAGSAYFQQFADNIRLAVTSRGFRFTSTTYGADVAQNVDAIDELVNSGVGAIVFQVQDEQGQAPTIQKLIDKGIYVIYSVAGPCNTQVIADQYQCGYVQGVAAAKWIKANMGGAAQVCVFNAAQISPNFIPRTQGRIDGVKTAGPNVQIVANEPIKLLTPEEGQQLAGAVFQAHPQVNCWLGDDDTMIGVVAALKEAGKKPSDKIFVSGFNGQANALAAVQSHSLFREDVAFPNGVYEYATGALCCDWIEGKSVPQIIDLGIFTVTPSNVAQFIADNNSPATAYKTAIGKYVSYYGNTSFSDPKYVPHAVSTGKH